MSHSGKSKSQPDPVSRRIFLQRAGGCGAWLALAAASPVAAARAFAAPDGRRRARIVVQEPWGRIEQLAEGVWAVVSTPLVDHADARRTLCNGGIVQGRDAVLIVEGFGSDAGAAWVSEQAQRLTGRAPTHVVITHYHGDHCNGLHGFNGVGAPPRAMATATTRTLIEERTRVPAERLVIPDDAIPTDRTATLDLGGRTVRLEPAGGHTPSDVVVRVDDAPVVFCGDLVWNGMFPNYMDAIPPRLAESVRAIGAEPGMTYVSGHGDLADADAMRTYAGLLDDVGAAARRAIEAGTPLEEAAAAYRLPPGAANWTLFGAQYFRTAFQAWERALRPG
jgi:glyoxylase-like metal-dependent hydrolase (beta-lactamase superfamily II)